MSNTSILIKLASRYASQPAMPQQPMGGFGVMHSSTHMPSMMGMGPNSGIAQAANAAQKNPNPLTKMSPGKHGLATAGGIAQASQQAQTSNQTPQQAPMQQNAYPSQPHQMPQQPPQPQPMMSKMGSLEAPDNWLLRLKSHFEAQVKAAETQTSGAQATTSGTSTLGSGGQMGTQNAQMPSMGTQQGRVGGQNQQGSQGGGSGVQGAMRGQLLGGGGGVGAYGVVRPGWNSLRPSGPGFGGVTSPQTKVATWLKFAMGLPPTPGLTANQPMPQPGMAPPPPGLPSMPPPNGGAPIPGTMGQPSIDPMTGAPLPPGGPGGAVDPATGMPMDPAASGGAPPGGAAPPPPAPTQPDPKTGQPSTSPMQDPPPLPLPSNPRMTPPRPRPTMKDMTQQGTMHSLLQDKDMADVPLNDNEATEDMKSQAMAMGSKTASDKHRIMVELGTASAMLLKSGFWKRAGLDPFTVPIGYPEIELSRTVHDGPPSWMKGVPGYNYVEPPRPFGSPDPNAATGEYKPAGQQSTATNAKAPTSGPRTPTGQTTQLYRPMRAPLGARMGQLMRRVPGGRAGLAMGGLGLLGGVGASQIPRLLQKKGSQDDDGNKDTAKSATGESKGLKYQYKADHHAQGQEAWESVSMYFKGHGKRGKNQPNPSLGKHAGDYTFHAEDCPKCGVSMEGDSYTGTCNSCGHKWGTKKGNDALKALLGMETSQLDIPAHTLPPPLAAQLNSSTPRDVPGVNLGIPILAGLSGLGLGYAAGHRSGKKKGKEKKAAYEELTPFARGFFEQCDLAGVDHAQAVEKVGSDFGDEAVAELRDGLTKLAGWRDRLATGGMKLLGWGEQGATKAAPSTFGATRGQLGNLTNQFGRNPMLQQGMQSANAADQAAARSLAREQAANYMRTNPNAARFWGSGFGNATYNAGARMGQAGQYLAPVGRQLAPTAGGAVMGGFAGDSMGMGGDSLEILPGIKLNYRGMAAGAAASNPFLRRRANQFAGGTLSMPMAGMRAAGVGSMGGGAFDQLAGAAGYDTGGAGARLGAWGGFGLGAARQGVRMAPNWMGGTNSGLARTNNLLGRAERGMGNFTNESFKGFFKPLTYPFRAGANYLRGAPQTGVMGGAAKGAAGRFGRMVGVGTLGLTGIGTGYGMLRDKITGDAREAIGQTAAELMPEVQDQAASFMDQYMMSRGMMDETGQFNPMMAANRQGGIMGGIMRGSDDIFRSLGMDPSRMSPLQKLMILGGSAAAGGGALAGAPALAGVGGVSALAGLLPQLMPSQSQQVMGNGAQAPYRPGQQGGQQAGVPGVNQFGPQGPQARNEWQMFQQPQQQGVGG